MSLPPLPEPSWSAKESKDYIDKYTAIQMQQYGQQCAEAERERLVSIVADDAYAMTFQTMGQYRTALLKAIRSAAST